MFGYSKKNQFKKESCSKIQNEIILTLKVAESVKITKSYLKCFVVLFKINLRNYKKRLIRKMQHYV